jgi:hypothetical protein
MNEEILKLADLSNVKVGDTIWTIKEGIVEIIKIDADEHYPIRTNTGSYTLCGKRFNNDKHPSAFLSNPFENVGFQERWLMVSNDEKSWNRRKVFMQKNGNHIAWCSVETDEEVSKETDTTTWKYAKEIEEPKELTLEERIERLEKLNLI